MAGGKIEILVEPDLKTFPGKLEAGLRSTSGIAAAAGAKIATALGAGLIGAGAGIAAVVKIGNEFDSTLSRIQATSGASAVEMGKVAARARELGTDASLAGTSSSQAAAAIEELAKAGLSVEDSMTVARDAIVLSRAGMLDGGAAASLLANTLNTYGLAAEDAGRVTDVFAATANASTTDVRDLGESLKYVGPVAAGLKISLEDTSTALAVLSTAGIKGSEAGTALRGVLASIAAPSGPAKKALDALGVSAFDQAGKFRGLEVITGQLTAAKGRMTDAEFAAAAAVAFGNEGMAAANVLATQGVGEFRDLGTAVREQGAASQAAAANSQGLAGAMDEFQGSAEDAAISLYNLAKGPLEDLTRGGADGLQALSDLLSGKGIDSGGLARVLEAGRQVLVNLDVAADPVREGLEDLFTSFEEGNGVTSAFSGSVTVLTGGVELLSRVLGPVGDLVGGVLTVFAALPGPVQGALAAFLGFRLVSGYLDTASGSTSKLAAAVNAVKPDGLRAFNDEARLQRGLAQAAGESIGRWGGYQAAFETSTGRTVTALRNFRDQTNSIRDGAAAAGEPIGRLSAVMGTLAERSGTLGQAAASFVTVRDRIVDAGTAADGTHGKFTTLAGGIGGVASAGGSLVKTGLGGLMGALGGPWGLAIGGAVAALSLFTQANADAEAAAAEHKSKVDELAGSFDKVTGAATAATRASQAQDLTNVKLADGTTTLAGALGKLGISTQDYVDATSGNIAKQQQIAEKLNGVTRAAIEQSPVWRNNATEVQRWGISLETVVAAANGNTGALDQLRDAAVRNAGGVLENQTANEMLVDSLLRLGGASGEVSSQFGAAIGELNEARTQYEITQQATADFTEGLKVLGNEGGRVFAALASGAPVTKEMQAALTTTGQAATNLALEQGKLVASTSNVEQGAIAAREKMQTLRDQFIAAATAAGLGVPQAEALANSYGLIPSAVETIIRTNASGVQAELITLKASFDAVPGTKSVVVQTLTEEARKQLEAMGFQIRELPDKKGFEVVPNTENARNQLNEFVAFGNGQVITMTGDMNVDPATQKVTATVQLGNGQTAVMTYDANARNAEGKIVATVDMGNGQLATMTFDADPRLATGQIDGTVRYGNGQTATLKLAADDGPARQTVKTFLTEMDGKVFTVIQRTQVEGTINGPQNAIGRLISPMARGGVLPMAGGGGLFNGRPMGSAPGGIAAFYPPNTPRIIGDRIRDDEAYIPINRSQRSRAIFEETARRMGYGVVRGMAEGGLLAYTSDLQRLVAANRAAFGSGSAGAARVDVAAPVVEVRNYIDGQEIRGMVRTEITASERATIRRARMGAGV